MYVAPKEASPVEVYRNYRDALAKAGFETIYQLKEMAAVLNATPALKVFIVGHTDNQGEFGANRTLSQKRAEAMVAALSSQYGIAPARLTGYGVASLAPVSANDSEDGRAKNRRVEMVVR